MQVRIIFAALLMAVFISGVEAEPGASWQRADAAPWIADVDDAVRDYADRFAITALMVVQGDNIAAAAGQTDRKVRVASVRKSMLGALYGIAIAERRIDPAATLAKLGIDDGKQPLTQAEKQATVRDLLSARSGIYLPAAHDTTDMENSRPARGSHAPGTFWFYNNWDFNALGTIYRQATGEDIYASFARRIAEPIGMEDFSVEDGRNAYEPVSEHPAYTFRMSARDLARFGLLYLNDGRWRGQQIVPADWVRESTTAHSQTDKSGRGYGYLWWALATDDWGAGAALASGHGGQLIAVIPARRLVVVQTVDRRTGGKSPRTGNFITLLRKLASAVPAGTDR
jgi:CubicO group peptidase (beta-lactamase class C family)